MRFARYWGDYAERYGSSSKKNYKTYNQLEIEWTNLDAAANWLWEVTNAQGDLVGEKHAAQMLSDLADSLRNFMWLSGRWDEHVQLSARAYEAMCALQDWRNAGKHAFDIAWIYTDNARNIPNLASEWAERCAEALSPSGSKHEQAMASRILGLVARQRKDYAEAERLLQDALAIWRDLALNKNFAAVLNDLGKLDSEYKKYGTAERYYQEALEVSRKAEEIEGEAAILGLPR